MKKDGRLRCSYFVIYFPLLQQRQHIFLLLVLILQQSPVTSERTFDPYQLNGGLVTAVAGRDFCLLASDTRMMDGEYQIYSRNLMRIFGLRGPALALPPVELLVSESKTNEASDDEQDSSTASSTSLSTTGTTMDTQFPVLVAAAGCESDCNALQRVLRYQLRAMDEKLVTRNVAQLVSSTLYSRRTFPYYSFCVVGGLDPDGSSQVFVYDAIGSMERVAVGTAGTGRELLQPILDRLFSSSTTEAKDVMVSCSSEDAMLRLIQAYQAVTEREIGVGDSLVLCLLFRESKDSLDSPKCRIFRFPLKTH